MNWSKEILEKPAWKEEISNREKKEEIARKVASIVKDGDVIGFGSGSTSYLAAIEIANKAKNEGLNIIAIPTSYEIKMLCTYLEIPTADISEKKPDWCFDGVDEIDKNGWIIKGRGAAMFNEKLNIASSNKIYILADESKMVGKLGEKFPIPVECSPKAINIVKEGLLKIGANEIKLRVALKKDGPVITENGNFVLDVRFNEITDDLERKIKSITGVVESGLFIGYNVEVIK